MTLKLYLKQWFGVVWREGFKGENIVKYDFNCYDDHVFI